MKKKELMKRLSAISMAMMMTVTMIPSNAYAADEIFSDVDVETTADAGDEDSADVDSADVEVSDADDTSDADIEVEDAEDDSADVNVEAEEDDSEEVDVFSDGGDSAEETDAFDAGEGTPAADAVVHMTVSVAGNLATAKDGTLMADRDVTVKDIDKNGILTYDEALIAAHDEYYNGGAVAGYASVDDEKYGKFITKLWGDESGNFGYWRNDSLCFNLSDEVKADDYLTAFVYKDEKCTDAYTKFAKKAYKTMAGSSVTIQEYKASYDRHYNVVFDTSNKENLRVYDSNFKLISEDNYSIYRGYSSSSTDIWYHYNITFNKDISGVFYVVTASTEEQSVVPAVTKVTVLEKTADFDSIQLYKSESDYKKGNAIEITPAFDPNKLTGYSVQAPDYLSSLYAVAQMSANAKEAGLSVMMSNNWGGWSGARGSATGIATGDAYFASKGYLDVYANRKETYSFNVETYATLKNLTIDGITDKAFDRDVNEYHAYVNGNAESVAITATELKKGYTIKINGTEVTSAEAYNLPYKWDADGKMKVSVEVSKEGIVSSVYTINLEKQPVGDAPYIMTQPKGADYIVGNKTTALSVVASANGKMTYQWYSNTTDSNEGGTAIKDATEASYTPSSEKSGTVYYYCVVTNTEKSENNTTTTETARITVDENPTPKAVITTVGNTMPEGSAWNKGYTYNVGDQAETLKVTATSAAEGGEFSYEWKRVSRAYNIRGYSSIKDNESDSYVPSTDISMANDAGNYYACEVTYTFKGKTYKAWATTGDTYTDTAKDKTYDVNGVYVFVKVDSASTPAFTKQPKDASYLVGDAITALSVSTQKEDGGKLTYQWYVNDKDSTDGSTAVEKGTSSLLSLGTASEKGTKYYYCVVTNTIQGYTAKAVSNIAEIKIITAEDLIGDKLKGEGTQEKPYLISTADDYKAVADLVSKGVSFDGKYLRQEADITLPEGWQPIGVTKDGSKNIQNGRNLRAFSGYLDGNGKTIAIPEGGLPLLGYVKNAEVHNLNIYGKKIAGYGLVNTLSGVGLSGNAIIIDNVTLKSGSSTLKSGLIGTEISSNPFAGCSAAFTTTIKNCTIEKDVVIGYDKDQNMIGSIAGRMHGTIENCVSYATVYGKKYVGGILGTRDNAMGGCSVTSCRFYGNVEGSDELVGGIVGGGYEGSSAPNGVKISINACEAAGSVTGADKVGGILGGDLYVAQAWNTYKMKGNSFTGKVQATTEGTKNIGAIIGFYDSLNKFDDIANNYYSKDCGADRGIGAVKYVDTNCETHETTVGEVYFNTEKDTSECPAVAGCSWKAQHNRTDDPLGADAAKLAGTDEVKVYEEKVYITGDYKTDYNLGEELDLTGMEIHVAMSDGTYKEVAPADAKIEGYNKDKRGEQKVRVICGAASEEFTVTVLKRNAEDIKVHFALLGDKKHNSDKDKTWHTLHADNLETWIADAEYEVDGNATVLDVISKVLTDNEYTWDNEAGNYISAITKADGTKLEQKDNGANSGWMYTLNGIHPDLAVNEQYLEDGDIIVFHYTDDYTQEHDHIWSSKWTTDENAHWHECTYEFNDCDITDNTKKSGYGTHTFDEGKVTKAATCKEAGEKVYTCTVCGYEKKEVLPKTNDHKYVWNTTAKATVFAPEKQQGTCAVCGKTTTRDYGTKLAATIKLNAKSIKLQKKQTTKKIKVTMANGDSIKSWKSSNKKIVTVNKKGVIKAGKKNGTAKITVTLASGKKATLKVKVQSPRVNTTKIKGLKSKVTLKKGEKLTLKPAIRPLTSQDKVTYTSSNKKVATVSKKGVITAKKKGTVKITVKSGKKSYTVKVKVK